MRSLRSLRLKTPACLADALRVEAETGSPLHIVREGKGERPVLVIRNVSQDRIAARGTLKMKGFFGDAIDLPVSGALDGGKTMTLPIVGAVKKGAWKITGELKADDGSVAKVDTRFAVMDYHTLTPKTPRGTFRLGINWHIARFTPADLKLTAEAMVATPRSRSCRTRSTRKTSSLRPWSASRRGKERASDAASRKVLVYCPHPLKEETVK